MKLIIDDGFRADLVKDAFFEGAMEIPIIKKPEKIVIPEALIPFSKRKRSNEHKEAIHFYEHDRVFAPLIMDVEKYLDEIKRFPAVISPDCSLYVDMPLCLQIANTYMNRAIGAYLQSKGIYVIPNVRWGDERSYTTCELPEKFAFLGIEKHSIVSIGTYGCIQGKDYEGYYRHCPAINNEKRQQILKKSVAFFIAVKAATKTTSTLLQKTSLFYRRKPPIIWASASASVNPKDISFIN